MRLLVIDSTGLSDVSDKYRSYFGKNIKLVGHEPSKAYGKTPSGAHGYQCGYYAGVLLNLIPGDHEIHYARIFDQHGGWIRGSENFILDVIHEVSPQVISNSWGQHDGDDPFSERVARTGWIGWSSRFSSLVNGVSAVPFFAAGNDDVNDADDDVAYPQRLIPELANIIGSHNRGGRPSVFSGDGKGVQVTMWGERVALLDGDGKWSLGSGTSFSCPKAAGLCAYLQHDHFSWRRFVREMSQRPKNWAGVLPHRKWGEGSLEYVYQEALALLPEVLRPPVFGKRRPVTYMDFDKISPRR
jgi:hypothetical protein